MANIEIDFDAIKDGGSRTHVAEGDYRAKIKAVVFKTSQSGNPMLVWTIAGTEGAFKNKEVTEYTALTQAAAFKLRDLWTAVTGRSPKGKVSRSNRDWLVAAKKLVGEELGVTLGDDEYVNDKSKSFISSKIQDYMGVDDVGGSKKGADIEEEDDDSGYDLSGLSRTELKALIKEHNLDIRVLRSMSDENLRDAVAAGLPDDEDEDDEDDDEDDGLDEMSRVELKAHIKSAGLSIKVLKSMDDDALRAAIREATSEDDDEDEEVEDVDLDSL